MQAVRCPFLKHSILPELKCREPLGFIFHAEALAVNKLVLRERTAPGGGKRFYNSVCNESAN